MNKKILSLVLSGLMVGGISTISYANEIKGNEVKKQIIQEIEPNSMSSQAQSINLDAKISGFKDKHDLDYFKFKLSNNAEVHLEAIVNPVDMGNLGGLTIYNSNMEEVYYMNLYKGINKKQVSLDKGNYYICVGKYWTNLYQNQTWNYELGVSRHYFGDSKDHWAESQINKFVDLGYVNGYEDGNFKPENSITRAEFVKILNRTFGLTKLSGKVFLDTSNHWARKDIDIAVTNGVCKGKSSTEFKPDDLITREEAAVMVSNYKKINDKNNDKINLYYDSDKVSSWAKDSVEGVIEHGYMKGYDDNTFRPQSNITRAEAVSTLSRVK